MKIAILVVGDELVAGDVEDSNAPWIARRARRGGHRVVGWTTVMDRVSDVARAVEAFRGRADLLVVTGGLGPTEDDLTREGVAQALGLSCVTDHEVLAELEERTGKAPSDLAARQANFPAGSEVLPNGRGSAPGFRVAVDGFVVACVPGVPEEMRPMVEDLFPPQTEEGGRSTYSMMAAGLPESDLGECLADLMDMEGEGLRVGITTKGGRHTITLREGSEEEREAMAATVRQRLGEDLAAEGGETLEEVVVRLAAQRGLVLTAAESCTGGLVAGALTSVSGSSSVFRESFVVYSNEAKENQLGISASLLVEHGAVSEVIAGKMAEGAKERCGADLSIAVTGIAGPDGGNHQTPVGMVCFGLATSHATETGCFQFAGSRSSIRARAVTYALDLLRRSLLLETG